MTTPPEHTLATDIESAVLTIPGVSTLFRAGTLASHVIDAGATLIGIRDDSAPLVRVDHTDDGPRVDIAIGVRQHLGAVDTTRRVHAAVRAALAERHVAPASIRITVVHINESIRQGEHQQ